MSLCLLLLSFLFRAPPTPSLFRCSIRFLLFFIIAFFFLVLVPSVDGTLYYLASFFLALFYLILHFDLLTIQLYSYVPLA
ncbi:hypothetical protein F5H01DRAFT_332862 [Linnemannia elongata]|nr:hypothetical protein F5H01DRAFT_332862 [Linnemannia elongata]